MLEWHIKNTWNFNKETDLMGKPAWIESESEQCELHPHALHLRILVISILKKFEMFLEHG